MRHLWLVPPYSHHAAVGVALTTHLRFAVALRYNEGAPVKPEAVGRGGFTRG